MPGTLPQSIYALVGRAIGDFQLIEEGDRLVLGVSGGKDSLLLGFALAELRRRAPVKFDLEALTIDLGEGSGPTPDEIEKLRVFFDGQGVPYSCVPTRIAKVVTEYPSKDTPCSLCANLRRGALYKAAKERGATKVALGHHLDDAIETLFLNMFYQGSLRCFHPRTYLSRKDVTVIRPLVYVPEAEITESAGKLLLPVVPTRCPHSGHTQRQAIKQKVMELARDIPGFRSQLRGALGDLWR